MADKYINAAGLSAIWARVKAYVDGKLNERATLEVEAYDDDVSSSVRSSMYQGDGWVNSHMATTHNDTGDTTNAQLLIEMGGLNSSSGLDLTWDISTQDEIMLNMYTDTGSFGIAIPTSDSVWRRYPDINASNGWYWREHSDGTFEAWYKQEKYSITITNQSGNLYRSNLITTTLPTSLTNGRTANIIGASVICGHNNYPAFTCVGSLGTNAVNWYALSGSSRTASPNYTLMVSVFGRFEST